MKDLEYASVDTSCLSISSRDGVTLWPVMSDLEFGSLGG